VPRVFPTATGLALVLALATACDREVEPLLCGDLAAGALVLTEVRGGPTITDEDGQWIEVFNASPAAIDLEGLAITFDSIGGNLHQRVLIRRSQMIEAGGYAVAGKFADGSQPAHVDVGWGTTPAIPRDGTITVSCGLDVDTIAFTSLSDPAQVVDRLPYDPPTPGHGTYALGLTPPTATGNDAATAWCADSTETFGPCDGSSNCLKYYKGSPGAPNRGCP
jgi:hypothetical protein